MSAQEFQRSKPIDWISTELDLEEIENNNITYGAVDVFEDRIGRRLRLPVITLRGNGSNGPILGLTAAVHGNEINGIPVIHRLVSEINLEELKGTVIAIPVVNLPGYLAYQREFIDGVDLNRIMPGKHMGTPSEVYAYHFVNRVLKKFNYLIDLHTASFGRINSHYIRADLSNETVRKLASLQHADIVVHTTGPRNSVRQTATDMGIPALTVELGNPQVFQEHIVDQAIHSLKNVMKYLGMLPGEIEKPEKPPVFCKKSYWLRVHDGGILTVHPDLREMVDKGQEIASLYDIYGRHEITYRSPDRGIVIGKNTNPVVSTGGRILHLGILED